MPCKSVQHASVIPTYWLIMRAESDALGMWLHVSVQLLGSIGRLIACQAEHLHTAAAAVLQPAVLCCAVFKIRSNSRWSTESLQDACYI